ncbi:hypothetical protein [Paraburkholderia megapolitana]|uniref:tRNA_anti-like n=1 Tax=Paraburkholderia megapolitana TaxID=420953 RepID=A0A1I3UUH1_9BURK|nr:hypothetical protein [Paraburkholderia megapolitana]QDQ82326.1 hypothetical protein FNZ07_13615 [Paraburkholderia megapolitana]SFJ85477.1 hypothetical protein SAMN05192543_11246 [Paraburkholderia megapolitana]
MKTSAKLLLLGFVFLLGCSQHDNDTTTSETTNKSTEVAVSQALQATFEQTRLSLTSSYTSAQHQSEKTVIYKQADEKTKKFWKDHGIEINEWAGRITEINTTDDYPNADIVITSDSGTKYSENNITSSTALSKELSHLSVGSKVRFSGKFAANMGTDDPSEISLTERDSMTSPSYLVEISDLKVSE